MLAVLDDLPIHLDGAQVRFGDRLALDGATLELRRGRPTVLVGPNGCGKTTLLRLAMGLIAPSAGRISWGGREQAPAERRAFVFQRPVFLRRSVAANLVYAQRSVMARRPDLSVAALLVRVGLSGFEDRPARRLSGGEQQRLALARALARSPDILFLDEPTASLDPASTRAVETIIAEIAAEGVKVVMATHDLGQARRLAGDIVFLLRGRVREHRPVEDFFGDAASPEAKAFRCGDLVI